MEKDKPAENTGLKLVYFQAYPLPTNQDELEAIIKTEVIRFFETLTTIGPKQ